MNKLYQPPTRVTPHVGLPPPNDAVYLGSHRVPKTNGTLARVGFDGVERDILFLAYGKDVVLTALALYFGPKENAHRDMVKVEYPEQIKSGLVATMESIRTRGRSETEHTIFSGEDIVTHMAQKYAEREPVLRVRNDGDLLRLEAIQFLVGMYVNQRTH